APGFAGSELGFSGSPNVAIAIIDTGIDASHPDLAGRMVGWKDYTTEASPTPIDWRGHGSEVAGVALGSGAAFGVGPGTLHYTDQGDLSGKRTGESIPSPVHLPSTFQLTSTARWLSGGNATLSLMRESDDGTSGYTTVSVPTAG